MLLESGRYEEAQAQYLAALERSPNRFNSLYGAGRAAEQGGDANKAALYYRKLVEVTDADAERERLQQAKTFLGNN
jgi:tetratricopeptide (TPR) repeat protein